MKCDADIFARMYEAVYQDLYRFALCLLKDRHEAEDAVGLCWRPMRISVS